MTEFHIQRIYTYLLGDDSLIPIGIDIELCYQNLLVYSYRLFDSHSDRIEILRLLSDNGSKFNNSTAQICYIANL